ncbi:hypothetical protein ACFYVL_08880 [Streptomyces sp. NPDC004111]|uniref:hypothetical protein n=1 Tax=Streptomyces sp. NPDC004111 TaxID=3364690 RepID=UPI00368A0894
MDPHGPIAQRFPLVARFRPACLPLPERVQSLITLAETAAHQADQGLASAVFNQSALIASDVDLPDLAREMCRQHADAYLHRCPLPAMSAIRGLEPLVNLARLQIRAGHGDDGRSHLLALFDAVSSGRSVRLDNITVPADLTRTAEDRQEVRAWLWRVLLADGTRTLTTEGRWIEALAHIEEHHGIGNRMLDGRQVAVIAALVSNDSDRAADLLKSTAPGDPWEQTVTDCLTALCQRTVGKPTSPALEALTGMYANLQCDRGMTVFGTRLGLAILDLTGPADGHLAHRIVDKLHQRTIALRDGYAARESLTHPLFSRLATERQEQHCRDLITACALGVGSLPTELHDGLTVALRTSEYTIRKSLIWS